MLLCSDSSYYVGVTNEVEKRYSQHQEGADPSAYTYTRRPVELVYAEGYLSEWTAIAAEKKIKKWSRKKKQALIERNFEKLIALSKKKFR
ncbi:MAG: GIY-YIG nuclease family protein [Flavobacteriales bacterium]|nr:GIY-YIG nuclease family protein [Flavobacteriales bacterium]